MKRTATKDPLIELEDERRAEDRPAMGELAVHVPSLHGVTETAWEILNPDESDEMHMNCIVT